MPRENSLSDSDGRSLTPDPEDEVPVSANSPTHAPHRSPFGGAHHNTHNAASKRSLQSRHSKAVTHQTATYSPWQDITPIEKFRAAARKIMAMRRGTAILGGMRQIGAEPGLDPRRASAEVVYGHIHEDCAIEIVDYSAVRCTSRNLSNKEFVELMEDPKDWDRQPWVKVRWINIGGLSWDVIKALALRYTLHPLALEDVFHGHSRNRSKADYYTKHLFIRVLCHELSEEEDNQQSSSHHFEESFTGQPRSQSPEGMKDKEIEVEESEAQDDKQDSPSSSTKPRQSNLRRRPLLPSTHADLPNRSGGSQSRLAKLLKREGAIRDAREERNIAEVSLAALKQGERVNVKVTPLFVFLYRDGTVITIHQKPNHDFSAPIAQRLRQRDTVLRTSVDPSILVHAILDLAVDKALQVIDEYHNKINHFERIILLKPDIKTVRHLHILSGDLILHKRTLEPIKTMIYGLRRYDVDRCAALIDTSDPANADVKVVGYMSHKAKIYLADVHDHAEYILTSLEMFAGIGENLIDYTFNLASYEMNEVMRRLTLATIIFLPLTLLTGYFGMNFTFMWSIHDHSDIVFWIIALPVMAMVIPMFLVPDIKRMYHYVEKRLASKKAIKSYKTA